MEFYNKTEFWAEFALVVVFAFYLERGLATVFDWPMVRKKLSIKDTETTVNEWKGPIVLVLAIVFVAVAGIDLIKATLSAAGKNSDGIPDWVSVGITGMIVAGGSQGAVKLFQDIAGFSAVARKASKEARAAALETKKAKFEEQTELARMEVERLKVEKLRQAALIEDIKVDIAKRNLKNETDMIRLDAARNIAVSDTRNLTTLGSGIFSNREGARDISVTQWINAGGGDVSELAELNKLRDQLMQNLDRAADLGTFPTLD